MATSLRNRLSDVGDRLSDRMDAARYRVITLWALIAICGIVVTGAAVRLTGSGLGCSNWPKCDDNLTPELEIHGLIEFANRTLTGVVSVAVMAAVLGSLVRRPRRRDLLRWSLGLVAGVAAQIVWGGVTVLSHLDPAVVSGHFLISMALIWNAVVLHHRAGLADGPDAVPARAVPGPVAGLATATTAFGAVALVSGTLVTGTGPHAGDATNPLVRRFGFDLLTVVRVHSAFMWVFVALITATAIAAHRRAASELTCRTARRLVAVAVAQGAIGYLQYFTGVPPLLVGLHVAGATAVWALTVQVALIASDTHSGSGSATVPLQSASVGARS